MSNQSRFSECRDKMFADRLAGKPAQREHLKRWGANKTATQRDVLMERETYCAKHYALGGLRSVCWVAGKKNDWIDPHIYGLCDKRPELTTYPRSIRVGH